MASRRIQLKNHLTREELKARYRACPDSKEARRWQALWLISQGQTPAQAATVMGLTAHWIRKVLHRYNRDGPEGVRDGHAKNPAGGKFRLSVQQRQPLWQALQGSPPGGLWTGPKVATWIEQTTGQKTYPQLGWVYLRRLGFTLKVPRWRHRQAATADEQAAFKKNWRL